MDVHPVNKLLWWCNLILRLASWIVPRQKRLEWRQEWEGEVWHWCQFLRESGRHTVRTEQELLRHCWGSFVDALWHRFNRVVVLTFINEFPRTPQFCVLACLALLAALLAGRPVAIFSGIFAPPCCIDPGHLLTVSLSEKSPWLQPELLRETAFQWPKETQLITSEAAYAWRPSLVRGPEGGESIQSAGVTPGMFELLGVRPSLGRDFQEADSENSVILSDALWKSQFHGDSNVLGRPLLLNSKIVNIIGVLPAHFRFPVRNIAVFSSFGTFPRPLLPMFEWPGVLVRVAEGVDAGTAKQQLQLLISRQDNPPTGTQLAVSSLKDLQDQDLKTYGTVVVLALLALLALQWQSFARLLNTRPHAPARDSWRWYLFFAMKNALLLLTVFFASLEIVQAAVSRINVSTHPYAGAAATWLFLFGATVVLRWSILDQFGRCRTCVRRLTVRVNLGSPAHVLLELTGVELVCDEGHGALHMPLMESSCVDSERWTYLHDSWHVLLGNKESRISVP